MTHVVKISYTIVQKLFEHAQTTPEIEVCGMLGGKNLPPVIDITNWQGLPNMARHPNHAYEFAPKPFIQTYYEWQQRAIDWVGVYHSHPRGALRPSQVDIAQANYRDKVHLIIGQVNHAWQVTAWSIIEQNIYKLAIEIAS